MREQSAGGMIVKYVDDIPYILLVEHKENTYVFPKGHMQGGETATETARREIKEEVGLKNITIGKELGKITRHSIKPDGTRVLKDITMFLVRVERFEHSDNAGESYQWFTYAEALKNLRYKKDAEFLSKCKEYIVDNKD